MSGLELHLLNLDGRLRAPVERYLPYFSDERRAAILRYRSPADRNRTLWAELLVRWLIERRTGRPAFIVRDARGKPYLLDEAGEGRAAGALEFSLSHSGPWVACCLGDAPNGVDVETDRRLSLDVAKRFFLREEYLSLAALSERDPEEGRRAFLRYWTLKESYSKCTGAELTSALKDADCEGLLRGEGKLAGRNFDLPDGGVLGVCAAPDALPDRISPADLGDVAAHFDIFMG